MSFIEGVGDEVTAFFVVVIVVALATLVTFIGHGSNLYSITPTHTRTVVRTEITAQQVVQHTNQEEPRNEHPQSNQSSNSQVQPQAQWQNSRGGQYHQQPEPPGVRQFVLPFEVEYPDEAEAESSSEEEESAESNSVENPETESPAAPEEENESHTRQEEIPRTEDANGIRVRLKYLDDTERTVTSNPSIKIGDFKRNHFSEDLANNKVVRLIFSGHLLRDTSTLESYRVVDNSVLHVQILQAQPPRTHPPASQSGELDISALFWPVVLAMLVLCWAAYLNFPQFFSLMSFGLMCLFSFSLAYVWLYLRN